MLRWSIPDYDIQPREFPDKKEYAYERRLTDPEDFAVLAAEYFHDHDDGWECSWPIDFHIVDEEGKVTVVEVDRESVPSFSGRIKENV